MNPEEKFLFDLQGYLVLKNVLSEAERAELNAIFDAKLSAMPAGRHAERVSIWGGPYQNLMDHPKIVPYLLDLIGSKFRLDHDYCIAMNKGDTGGHLHGGEGHEGDHWYKYRDGVMKNGLTVFTYCLTPAPAGVGGFACIPGTHKSNFLDNIPREVMRFERPAPYVVQPVVEAGDVIIFTEALVHGTLPWQADFPRRSLLYKFSPGHSAWRQQYYLAEEYTNLTEQQKRVLAPPSVGGRPDVVQTA